MQTGLLMSVIRSLTASRDTVERDREKANLQHEFHESDGRLDKLVLTHHADLTSVMQAFSKISTRLNSSKERVQSVREKLTTCQKLLHCKRDELKRLWLESVEIKHVLKMLDQVEAMWAMPNEIRSCIDNKDYEHGTKLLIDTLATIDADLRHVDALSEVKAELIAKKEEIYELCAAATEKNIASSAPAASATAVANANVSTTANTNTNTNLNTNTNTTDENAAGTALPDLNSYFAKKKIGLSAVGSSFGKKKCPLFRFDASSHAISLNAYLREQKEAARDKSELATDALDSVDVERILAVVAAAQR